MHQQSKALFQLAIFFVLAFTAGPLLAQSTSGLSNHSIPPRRPSVSPYLNLGIENTGTLPSYQAFVLPRLEQQKQQMTQFALQGRATKIEELVDPALRQTGLGGKFQNYSHFYPAQNSRSRPR